MRVLDPTTIDPFSLPVMPLAERHQLPFCAAVYFVLASDRTLLYIGRSKCLRQRWELHHLLDDLTAYGDVNVAWLMVEKIEHLSEIEMSCIQYFRPSLNKEIRHGRWEEKDPSPPCTVERINVDFRTPEEIELLRLMKSSLALKGKKIREWLLETLKEQFAHDKKK